jgi:hypothetical protein
MKTKSLFGAGLCVMCLIGLAIAQQSRAKAVKNTEGDSIELQPPPPPPRGFGPPNPIMIALDADKDGTLSAAEISNAATVLAALDANGDGRLTADELRPPRPEPPKAGQAPKPGDHIMRLDTDGDGFVTFEEFTAPMKEAFSNIDTNKDNKIDADEAAAAPPPPPCHRGPHPPRPDAPEKAGAAKRK